MRAQPPRVQCLDVDLVSLTRNIKSSLTRVVPDEDSGTCLQQDAGDCHATTEGGMVKGGIPVLVAHVEICVPFDEESCQSMEAEDSGKVEL